MKYSVIILEVDWDEETVKEEACYFLGEFRSSFYHIQPIGDNILLVDCRCPYNNGNPEKNAMIISLDGKMIDSFCLGDGIQNVYVCPDHTIVTSYFDEGVFGNFGYDKHGIYEKFDICSDVKSNEMVKLFYEDNEILLIQRHDSYSSKALFIDNKSRLFLKRFVA